MIDRRFYARRTDGVELCETFSTENYKLKQVETDRIYGASVIDVVDGYDDDGKPYSRFTYIETETKDDEDGDIVD